MQLKSMILLFVAVANIQPALGRSILVSPVDHCNLSLNTNKDYGIRTTHPITGQKNKFHGGIDLGAPSGTPYRAPGDGIVTKAGKINGLCGYIIEIKHSDNLCTHSCHMHPKGFPRGIKPGVRVRQGQIVGRISDTGSADGAHAHFVTKRECGLDPRDTIDPFSVITTFCGQTRQARNMDGEDYQAIEDRSERALQYRRHSHAAVSRRGAH
jgi:murein DD-endopeptidase MepM/ murein hydrolase activator NlpD